MPKTKISEYSVTNSSNTDIEGINIDEGCAPSGINNAIRELMVHLKEFQTGASGDAFTFAGGVLISGTANTITGNVLMSGTNTITGSTTATFAAGAVGTPSIAAHGDTNTGIFFPAADTIAFAEGGVEAMRITSDSRLGIGTTIPQLKTAIFGTNNTTNSGANIYNYNISGLQVRNESTTNDTMAGVYFENGDGQAASAIFGLRESATLGALCFATGGAGRSNTVPERMRIDSSGNVGIGTASPVARTDVRSADQAFTNGYIGGNLSVASTDSAAAGKGGMITFGGNYTGTTYAGFASIKGCLDATGSSTGYLSFGTTVGGTGTVERARIDSSGRVLIGTTNINPAANQVAGVSIGDATGRIECAVNGSWVLAVGRNTNDGDLVLFQQAGTTEGSISVSGATVSYNAFAGSHWSQLQQGRGYNPEILRGTVMSTIGEMCDWKSAVWNEVIEHPAVPAVEAKEAVLDEEGNVVEPAVEAVEGKDAWTETINKREAYLGQLPVGATFEEDGVTKTVVDDGNERLPKVKISDVVGDKAVYGVFQTWDEVQDMLVTSLGAFVVRIAAGVTVQIGDLLESNGDGCAKVQDDDVIRSKTIGKVTSITPSATYADGSYTVPAVLYCG